MNAERAALDAANLERKRQSETRVESELLSMDIDGSGADVSDLLADPRYWDAENEQFTDAGLAEIDRLNRAVAEERAGFKQAISLDDLNDDDQMVMADAFHAYASALGLHAVKLYSAGGSKYVEVNVGEETIKFRFADHYNTVRDTSMQPDFNVAPGANEFTAAIDHLNEMLAR